MFFDWGSSLCFHTVDHLNAKQGISEYELKLTRHRKTDREEEHMHQHLRDELVKLLKLSCSPKMSLGQPGSNHAQA